MPEPGIPFRGIHHDRKHGTFDTGLVVSSRKFVVGLAKFPTEFRIT